MAVVVATVVPNARCVGGSSGNFCCNAARLRFLEAVQKLELPQPLSPRDRHLRPLRLPSGAVPRTTRGLPRCWGILKTAMTSTCY